MFSSAQQTVSVFDNRRTDAIVDNSLGISAVAMHLGSFFLKYSFYLSTSEETLICGFLSQNEKNKMMNYNQRFLLPGDSPTNIRPRTPNERECFLNMMNNYVVTKEKAQALKQFIEQSNFCSVAPDNECKSLDFKGLMPVHDVIVNLESCKINSHIYSTALTIQAKYHMSCFRLLVIANSIWQRICSAAAVNTYTPSVYPKKNAGVTQYNENKPSVSQLKTYYSLQAGFFNASDNIFKSSNRDKVIQTLKDRARENSGGASQKTLEHFNLR